MILDGWWFFDKEYTQGAKQNLFLAYSGALGAITVTVISPFILYQANKGLTDGQVKTKFEAFKVFSAYITCLIVGDVVEKVCQYFIVEAAMRIDENVTRNILEKIVYTPLAKIESLEKEIDIKAQFFSTKDDINLLLQDLYILGALRTVQILGVLFASFFLVKKDRLLSSVFVSYILLSVVVNLIYQYKFSPLLENIEQEWNLLMTQKKDSIGHHYLVRLYSQQEREIESLLSLEKKFRSLNKRKIWIENGFLLAHQFLTRLTQLGMLSLIAADSLDPKVNFTSYDLAIIFLFFQLIQIPTQQLNATWRNVLRAERSLSRTKRIINIPDEQLTPSPMTAANPYLTRQDHPDILLEYQGVSFAYPGTHQMVLCNISFQLKLHTVTVLIGENGIGKSTLLYLLQKIHTDFQGNIVFNGQNIHSVSKEILQNKIAFLPQETDFFSTKTLAHNIALDPPASETNDHQLMNALDMMELGFLKEFRLNPYPHNYPLSKLSEGEQRRADAARCWLRKETADLFIFDEPVSKLDVKNTLLIMEKLRNLSLGKTILLVTNNLKFAKSADQVLFMYRSSLIAQLKSGTHESLLSRDDECGEKYRTFNKWNEAQFEWDFWKQSRQHSLSLPDADAPALTHKAFV